MALVFQSDFDNSAIANLPATLTLDGSGYTPDARYRAEDATTAIWDQWTYGAQLAIAGAGNDVIPDQDAPFLDSDDVSVEFDNGKYFTHATLCDADEEDIVWEVIYKVGPAATTDGFITKGSGAAATNNGWGFYMASTNKIVLQLADGAARTWYDSASACGLNQWSYELWGLSYGNWVHAVRNGAEVIHDEVASGHGTLTNGSAFNVGYNAYNGTLINHRIAYFAIWIGAGMINASSDLESQAAERFAALNGLKASTNTGGSTYPTLL